MTSLHSRNQTSILRFFFREFQLANEKWPTNCVFWRSSTENKRPQKIIWLVSFRVQLNYHSKPRLFRLVKKIPRFRSKGRWIVGELGKRGSWAPVQADELLQLILNKSLRGFEQYLFVRLFFPPPSIKRPRRRCQKFILSISLVIKVMENLIRLRIPISSHNRRKGIAWKRSNWIYLNNIS